MHGKVHKSTKITDYKHRIEFPFAHLTSATMDFKLAMTDCSFTNNERHIFKYLKP